MNKINKEIPKVEFPSIKDYNINHQDERLISLKKLGLLCDSQYYKQGIAGAYRDCYARESVAYKLLDV